MTDKPLTILAIDCSTSACSAALRRGDALLAVKRVIGRGQAEAMVPLIGDVLKESGLDWPEIQLIGITVGPGSFTGLRIGLAAARALALARSIPIAGVTTADLLAAMVPPELYRDRRLLIAIDSKRDDLFVAVEGEIRALLPEAALAWQSGPLLVAGDAAEKFRGLRDDIEILPLLPDAEPLAELAARRYREGTALPAQPLYLRPPDVALPAR
jgi:tRNA threonylcarbamoyladenosine biosynthesis protein TsaB